MTIREYYQSVLDANISEEMNTATQTLIAKLDARNEKRKSADSKQKREVADRQSLVLNFLKTNEGVFTRENIAEACGISVGQAQSAALALVRGGFANKSEVKVDKTKRVVYSIA
jgi:Fic family protein